MAGGPEGPLIKQPFIGKIRVWSLSLLQGTQIQGTVRVPGVVVLSVFTY